MGLCAVSDHSQSNRNCRHVTDTITGKLAWGFRGSPVSQVERFKYFLRRPDSDCAQSAITDSQKEIEIFLEAPGFRLCAVSDHS